jgi:DNA-directed RNA polymerase subunit beta
VKNEDIVQPGVPESFKVLVKELQSLGLSIEVINNEEVTEEHLELEDEPEAVVEKPVAASVVSNIDDDSAEDSDEISEEEEK